MNATEDRVAAHYGGGGLYGRIMNALKAGGVDPHALTADDLKPFDEFHIGGEEATAALLDQLDIGAGTEVLDIGSGIGGAARMIASRYGADVTGVDLTPEFVETAKQLTEAVGLKARFVEGSALDLPFEDESFDLATLLHVGMNLPDKTQLFKGAARVLKHGGTFAVYDVMRFGAHPVFPVPWAAEPEGSFLGTTEDYLVAAEAAHFKLRSRRDRGDVAKAFFAKMQAQMAKSDRPPDGLPVVMGDKAPAMIANMVQAVAAGDIAPVEMIFDKR
ncbi:Erythromycin 3''-O-methyltransferase [Defluviimonas aquaemixtae]|uniref:Erythromycin 3''-O-methyltransferase n=1 Tax=Albidovulum aquaemixtae TaxID=1542388 RepID=A0A2R8B7E9_9RHOB|nr:class I SAM-dependent methyltransferase [Defluviimonas aquaemixtae]SPH18433.1 Erythromycin 3''-O-methyltransferase [Defluviimonas aquaemixtae]